MQVSNIIISNKRIRDKVLREKMITMGNSGLNIFGYKACEIAYNECEEWLNELLQVISRNKKLVEEFMRFLSNN